MERGGEGNGKDKGKVSGVNLLQGRSGIDTLDHNVTPCLYGNDNSTQGYP